MAWASSDPRVSPRRAILLVALEPLVPRLIRYAHNTALGQRWIRKPFVHVLIHGGQGPINHSRCSVLTDLSVEIISHIVSPIAGGPRLQQVQGHGTQ